MVQSGSIVVVQPWPEGSSNMDSGCWIPKDDEETAYMVKDVAEGVTGMTLVTFEEGKIIVAGTGKEGGWFVERVKEILPPQDISIIMQECMHNCDRLVTSY